MRRLYKGIVIVTVLAVAMGGVAVAENLTGPVKIATDPTAGQPGLSLNHPGDSQFGFDIDVEQSQVGRLDLYGKTNTGRTHALSIMRGSGNVGIGTKSPAAKLQIATPDTTVAPGLSLRQANDSNYGFDIDVEQNQVGRLDFYRVVEGVRTQVLSVMRGNGNVGIGTPSPAAKLDVAGEIIADDVSVETTDGLVSVVDLIAEVDALQAQVNALQLQVNNLGNLQAQIDAINAALSKPGASGISRY